MFGGDWSTPEPLLVMEYCSGRSLATKIEAADNAALPASTRLAILCDVASGLRYLHAMNPPIGHFDLKPANVLLMADATAKLADFGHSLQLSKRRDGRRGTPRFRAPEVVEGRELSVSADMWSFACVLVCVCEWRQEPYQFDGGGEACDKAVCEGKLVPSVSEPAFLAEVCRSCVDAPQYRWSSAKVHKSLLKKL